MNLAYRLIMTFNSTFWIIVIYGIKSNWDIIGNRTVTAVVLVLIPMVLSVITILFSRWFLTSKDKFPDCNSISLADHEFLPVYLSYFFVALSVPDDFTLIFIYMLVFVFSFLSQSQYFNPILILFGYHYYHFSTVAGTNFFVVSRGNVIRGLGEVKVTIGELSDKGQTLSIDQANYFAFYVDDINKVSQVII